MTISKDITGIIVLYDTTIEIIDCLERLKNINLQILKKLVLRAQSNQLKRIS